MELKSIEDGARELLKDTATVLSQHADVKYVVIGGWCPVIRNTTKLKHPGTLDVDILFEDSYQSGSIKNVIKSFLDHNFIPSAKHPFQLLKEKTINNYKYIYNIDLLHPNMMVDDKSVGMFVDHLDLDIPINNSSKKVKNIVSIALPNSNILFKEYLYNTEKIDDVEFNLITFDGMFMTKMDSCQKQKRERDSFDIYLGFKGGNIDVKRVKEIAGKDVRIKSSLTKFKAYLRKNGDTFNSNVEFFSNEQNSSPADFVLQYLKC